MTEHDITQWADLVRGLVEPDAEQQMRENLSRSRRARREAAAMRTVADLARADLALEVPEYAIRGAKAIGSLRRPEAHAAASALAFLPFTVAFDSLRQRLPVGTRTLSSSDRQLIFEAGDLTVEVRLEREIDPAATVVVGELLRTGSEDAIHPVPEVPVLIRAGQQIVGRSVTGRFGEFQAEGLPDDPLRLCLLVGQNECLELPLGQE